MHDPIILRFTTITAYLGLLGATLLMGCGKDLDLDLDPQNASAPACSTQSVIVGDRPHIYTWIDLYADGHRDTAWSNNTMFYPGASPIPYRIHLASSQPHDQIILKAPEPRDTLVCVGDSLWLDGSKQWHWVPAGADTTWLNWGPQARDSLVEPKVQIVNKESILAALDTIIPYQQEAQPALDILQWYNDVSFLSFESSQLLLRLGYYGDGYCSDAVAACPTLIRGCMRAIDATSATPTLGFDHAQNAAPGLYNWKLVVSNRFGYSDSLVGTTRVLAFSCPTAYFID